MRIEVWLNGAPVVDYTVPPSVGEYAPCGRIGLQVHGGLGEPKEAAARFREIRVRELPVFGKRAIPPPPAGARSSTVLRSRASRSTGRRAPGARATASLECLSGSEGGDLRTLADFQDFDLRLEFETAEMANSGVFLRARRDDSNPAFSGCEIQILDDFHWEERTKTVLAPWQKTGSLYGSVPAAAPGLLRPIGEWNRYEIRYAGTRLAVALNGRTLYDVDVLAVPGDPPFSKRAPTGFIGLQRHASEVPGGGAAVAFRNLFVRKLP
jgi:hypothetical protein